MSSQSKFITGEDSGHLASVTHSLFEELVLYFCLDIGNVWPSIYWLLSLEYSTESLLDLELLISSNSISDDLLKPLFRLNMNQDSLSTLTPKWRECLQESGYRKTKYTCFCKCDVLIKIYSDTTRSRNNSTSYPQWWIHSGLWALFSLKKNRTLLQ